MPEEDLDLSTAEGEGEEGEGKGKKKFPLKLIIIIAAILAVLGAGAYFGLEMFLGGEEEAAQSEEGKDAKAEGVQELVVALEPFIVNLADPSGKRYLKLTLTVDTNNQELAQELKTQMPKIRDSILLLLTSKSFADISPVAGKLRLRNQVLKIINRALAGTGTVHAVYFTEFVIQ